MGPQKACKLLRKVGFNTRINYREHQIEYWCGTVSGAIGLNRNYVTLVQGRYCEDVKVQKAIGRAPNLGIEGRSHADR